MNTPIGRLSVGAVVSLVFSLIGIFPVNAMSVDDFHNPELITLETELGAPETTLSVFSAEQTSSVHPRGPKSFLIKQGLKIISSMIRKGGDEFLNVAGRFFDARARSALKKHASSIANAIDEVARIPDLAGHIVRQKLFDALRGPIGAGNAAIIADAVEWAIWSLV